MTDWETFIFLAFFILEYSCFESFVLIYSIVLGLQLMRLKFICLTYS